MIRRRELIFFLGVSKESRSSQVTRIAQTTLRAWDAYWIARELELEVFKQEPVAIPLQRADQAFVSQSAEGSIARKRRP